MDTHNFITNITRNHQFSQIESEGINCKIFIRKVTSSTFLVFKIWDNAIDFLKKDWGKESSIRLSFNPNQDMELIKKEIDKLEL